MTISLTRAGFAALATAALFAVFATPACGSHAGAGVATTATCPTNSTLTYASFGEPFMKTYCLRCHSESVKGAARNGAPDDHNFDKADDIRSLAEHIDQYAGSGPAGTNEIMPTTDPKPTWHERQQLSQWLACGAP